MLLLGLQAQQEQEVLTNGLISLGNVYRKYCKKNQCGIPTFATNGTSVSLRQQGIYHITATLVGSATASGVVSVSLVDVSQPTIPLTTSSQTITTIDTEERTFVLDYYILVDTSCVLNSISTIAKTLALINTGVGATFTNVVFNVEKV